MRVLIGISEIAREIELDIEDVEVFVNEVETAIAENTPILWVTDTQDHRVGIPVARIGFVDIIPEHRMAAGFR